MNEAEQRNRILEVMTDAAFINADERIAYANPALFRLLGVKSPAELLGKPALSIFHPRYHELIRQRIERMRAQLIAVPSIEEEVVHLVGGNIPVEVVATTLDLATPTSILVILRDLRRGKEAALSQSEVLGKQLFDCVADPLFVYEPETLRFLSVNDAAIAHYGYSRGEFLSMTIKDIRPAEDVPALLAMLCRADAGEEARGPWRHHKRDGSIIHVEISAHGLLIDGRSACLVHARDVSARLEAERVAADARAALQQSQLLARIASKAARLGGWVMDLREKTVTWSDEVCILHDVAPGYRPELEEALDFYAPEHREAAKSALTDCMKSGTPFDLELELISAMKRRLWVRAIGDAVRDDAGHVVEIQGAFQDISAARRRLDAVRLSEERFRVLSRTTNDAVWDWDMVSGARSWNEGAETIFGQPRAEIEPTQQFYLDRIHPEDFDATTATIKKAVESGAPAWSAEYRLAQRNGDFVWVLDRGYVMRDASGAAVRMIGGMNDLTARKRDEERMAEQAALLDEARDAIVVRDLELRATYWNRSAAQLYGFDAENPSRTSTTSLYVDQAKVNVALWTTLEHGGWKGELQVNGVGDRALLVASHWSLVKDKAGRPRALLIISTDITEKQALEAQFIRAQRMESIGTLAGGIAHDLNNVLAPILASIEFLKSDLHDNPEALDTLGTLDLCARRGADLVKQVLSFARGVEGQRMTVNLAHLGQELFQVLEDMLPRSITLRFDASSDLWTVNGDATQLHQVLLNLCVNARDAMPAGGNLDIRMQNIVLDETYASMNVDARPGPYVMVQVKDTGSGIPSEIRDRIFDPFFTTKEIGKGTGLGLSTTLTIVKSHGGFINLYSEPGRGTKFKVYLPSNTSKAAADETLIEQTGLPRGDGELLLVVDDEEPIRKIVEVALKRFGYEVLLARHGAEAVALFAQHRERIALVLTDMAMPVMDGPATILAIRAIDPDAKIVGSSGLTANGDVAKAMGAGVKHFVAKPYTAEALLNTLAKALGKAPAS